MNHNHIALPIGLGCAALASWSIGGAAGAGVAVGVAVGAAACMLGLAWQGHALRTRPERALRSNVESFLANLLFLCAGGILLRIVDPEARAIDWRTFLVGFAAAAALVPPVGLIHITRQLAQSRRVRAP